MRAEKQPCDLFKVARQCGVRLLDPDAHRPVRLPGQCFAKRMAKKIGQRHGEAHLALVFRLIVETRGNAAELYAETLSAVSGLLAHAPHLVDRGGALFDDFDRIDLADTRRRARALACGLPASNIMRVLLAIELYRERDIRLEMRA